jgi:hypothetical protein
VGASFTVGLTVFVVFADDVHRGVSADFSIKDTVYAAAYVY